MKQRRVGATVELKTNNCSLSLKEIKKTMNEWLSDRFIVVKIQLKVIKLIEEETDKNSFVPFASGDVTPTPPSVTTGIPLKHGRQRERCLRCGKLCIPKYNVKPVFCRECLVETRVERR